MNSSTILRTQTLNKIEKIKKATEKKPFSTPDFLSLIEDLEYEFEESNNSKDYSLPYMMSLLGDRIVEFSIEDNYVPYKEMKKLYSSVIDNYRKLLTDSDKTAYPNEFNEILKTFREAHLETTKPSKRERLQKFILVNTENELLEENFDVKMHLAPLDGPFQVSSWYYPYLFDIDTNVSDPKIGKKIIQGFSNLYDKTKRENGANKLCFIRKRKGPQGASLLAGALGERTGDPLIFYTQRHFRNDSRLNGSLLEDGDNISIIYDMAVSGEGLVDCGKFLLDEARQQGLKDVRVESAIVFCDYERGAEKKIEKSLNGAKLFALTKMPLERYEAIRKNQFDEKMNSLNKLYENKEISFSEYDKKNINIIKEFSDLAWSNLTGK